MKVHEYQAKELLKKAGVAVPEGIVATTPAEAAKAYDALGGGLIVVKAQVHAGGRGKGVAVGPGRRSCAGARDRQRAQAAARVDGQGGATRQVGRGGRKSRRQPAGQDAGHLPDRCAGKPDLQGAGHGRARHRPRALPGPGDRPRLAMPGRDGHDRRGRRYRDRRSQHARKDPPRAGRRRPGPGRFPGEEDLQGARPDGRLGQERGDVSQELRQALHRHRRLARRDQPADRDGQRRRAGARLQAQFRRQRPVPPSRHRRAPRPGRRRSRPSCGPARAA